MNLITFLMQCTFKVHKIIDVIPLPDLSFQRGPINVQLKTFRAISMVFSENSLIPMSSSIHLQCVVDQFSLTRLCKQLTEHQRMGDVSADAHPSVVLELFLHKSEFPRHLLTSQVFLLC